MASAMASAMPVLPGWYYPYNYPCIFVPFNSEPTTWSSTGTVHGAAVLSPPGERTSCEQLSSSDGDSTSASSHGSGSQHRRKRQRQRKPQHDKEPQHDEAFHQSSPQHSCPQPEEADAASSADSDMHEDLLARLKEGGEARHDALRVVQSQMLALSFNAKGCWVVQYALSVAETKQAVELVEAFRTHVPEAVRSLSANFVIQKAVEVLPVARISFIIEEMTGFATAVACSRSGCRILSHLLEHNRDRAAALIDEALADARTLCHHPYGHFVMQAVLEHGRADQKRCIVAAFLEEGMMKFAHKDRNSCHMVEYILIHCEDPDQRASLDRAFAEISPGDLVALATDESGSKAILALLERGAWPRILETLQQSVPDLDKSKYGRRVMSKYFPCHTA